MESLYNISLSSSSNIGILPEKKLVFYRNKNETVSHPSMKVYNQSVSGNIKIRQSSLFAVPPVCVTD